MLIKTGGAVCSPVLAFVASLHAQLPSCFCLESSSRIFRLARFPKFRYNTPSESKDRTEGSK